MLFLSYNSIPPCLVSYRNLSGIIWELGIYLKPLKPLSFRADLCGTTFMGYFLLRGIFHGVFLIQFEFREDDGDRTGNKMVT